MTPSTRAIQCVRLLQRNWQTKESMAEYVGVNPHTIKRYLRAIRDAGFELEIVEQGGPGEPRMYRIKEGS